MISSLAEVTKPRKYDAMMAGDIKISTQILSEVVKFNERFANGNVADQGDIEVSDRTSFGQFRSLVTQSGITKN